MTDSTPTGAELAVGANEALADAVAGLAPDRQDQGFDLLQQVPGSGDDAECAASARGRHDFGPVQPARAIRQPNLQTGRADSDPADQPARPSLGIPPALGEPVAADLGDHVGGFGFRSLPDLAAGDDTLGPSLGR